MASILPPSAGIHGRPQVVDLDDAVRVAVLPGELLPDDLDLERGGAGGCARHVRDPGQLDEHERGDREQHEHGADGPRQLEACRAVDLHPVGGARPVPAPVAHEERDEQPLDEHEDHEREGGDEPEALADPLGVRRLRRDRREPAVPRPACAGEGE
jgi:hypothetical protein